MSSMKPGSVKLGPSFDAGGCETRGNAGNESSSVSTHFPRGVCASATGQMAMRGCYAPRPGARKEASGPVAELIRHVGLQTTGAVTPAVASNIDPQKVGRIGGKTSPKLPSEISRHVAVGFAPQIGRRIAGKTHPPTPTRTPLRITPGTVLRTVPTPVRGASISACSSKAVRLTCGAVQRYVTCALFLSPVWGFGLPEVSWR